MQSLTSLKILLVLKELNHYLNLGIKNSKKIKISNGKVHIPVSEMHFSPEVTERLHFQNILPFPTSLGASIENGIVSIPILKLVKFTRNKQKLSNESPSLEELCLNKIYDSLEKGSISKHEIFALSDSQLDHRLMSFNKILKNNSPIFKAPSIALSINNQLTDNTPADPYNKGAIILHPKVR